LNDTEAKDWAAEMKVKLDKMQNERRFYKPEERTESWVDAATGLQCVGVKHPSMGHWCGYVAIPKTHKWFGLHYNKCMEGCGESWCGHTPECVIDVHGGITYSSIDENDELFWYGFDCAHLHDHVPGMTFSNGGTFKDLNFIKDQCANMARQLTQIT
jgi:hypothetical protein